MLSKQPDFFVKQDAPAPLVVAYGVGVDSTAMLVGLRQRGIRPDLILFADVGDEKPETYAYLPIMNQWLEKAGFPQITVVKNMRPKSGDVSLSASLLRLGVLPSLAYGGHSCSLVWKRDPQHKFIKNWQPAIECWSRGDLVRMCIGYDASPRDSVRQYKAEGKDSPGFKNEFPLQEWGWDREECKRQIAAAGLPIPGKSACFHCPASKKHEIEFLRDTHPDLFARALQIELKAQVKGLKTIKGLGRSRAWSDIAAMSVTVEETGEITNG
jgi:3'-phosphoadenosine 5'-phosphosulfate sulfotransferase (PAPS reductase)/FAD synthetase